MTESESPTAPPSRAASSTTTHWKEFRCTWGNCTKSFSRAEHLHRHALNHQGSGTTCQRCSAVFKRPDLLDRHMARHKEKDDEAGGEGLGKLLTRKRLWRDSTGAIVARKRPEHEHNKKKRSASQSDSSSSKRQTKRDSDIRPPNQTSTPLSPPRSLDRVSNESPDAFGSDVLGDSHNLQASASMDQWPLDSIEAALPVENSGLDPYDFLCNASWGYQPFQDQSYLNSDLPYDDIFGPDTASSFNMPFTTMNYYSWLFSNESSSAATFNNNIASEATVHSAQSISNELTIGSAGVSAPFPETFPEPHQINTSHTEREMTQSNCGASISGSNSEFALRFDSPRGSGAISSSFTESLHIPQNLEHHSTQPITEHHNRSTSERSHSFGSINDRYIPTPPDSRSSQDFHSKRSRQSRKLPIIDENAREGLLCLIDQAHPKNSDGSEISRYHPLLSLPILQHFSDLFFTRFNVSYPLLHQATFEPARVDPLLLASVLQLGATYSSDDDHLFAIYIHNIMRTQIFSHIAFHPRPTLWMLQTILLVECFGKSRAGQLQHDMSHLFHGLLINLIRRSDCQSARCQKFSQEVDLDTRWRAEVDAEQRRRLALLCFMWDTQHAVLFSQSLCMNAAELKLTLPWDSAVWEADTAEEWYETSSLRQPSPAYLSVLKAYINPESGLWIPKLNSLSRLLMLHGLMSVAWDLNRRDQTSLGMAITGKNESWQSRIARSYDAWKADYDTYSKEKLLSLEGNPREQGEFQRLNTSTLAIYHAAYITLHVDIIDMQIYAGANHIIGRPVMKADRERSRQRIKQWAKVGSQPAMVAATHAASILRDGIRKLQNWDADDVFHYPWCLYLATLTCWAFQISSKADESQGHSGESEDESANDEDTEWDCRAEMNALVSAMTRSKSEDLWKVAAKYRTGDLPRVMARHLSTVRWAVVQEGMIVLRGLVGKRSTSRIA